MQIEYLIKYSNRKTLNITVERDRQVVVHAPANLSEDKIREIISSKKDWIMGKLIHVQKYPVVSSAKEFVSGEALMYLGTNYQLSIVETAIDGIVFNGKFEICRANQREANMLFKKWYKNKAIEVIKPIADDYAKNLGVKFKECKISEMKYRWGSCTSINNINFNWRIIKSPLYVIRYIVVHELVHLIERNHSDRFWNIISIQIPDFQKAKDWLKENGNLLEIDF